jgi:hypothetical protein
MHQSAEQQSPHTENHAPPLVAANHDSHGQDIEEPRDHGGMRKTSSVADTVSGFIERNPLIAAGAALAAGAAVVMAVQSRRSASHRLDRRMHKAMRSLERTFSREMRALERSDMADRLGQLGSSLGNAFSRVDLGPLAERGRFYLDTARKRLGA